MQALDNTFLIHLHFTSTITHETYNSLISSTYFYLNKTKLQPNANQKSDCQNLKTKTVRLSHPDLTQISKASDVSKTVNLHQLTPNWACTG